MIGLLSRARPLVDPQLWCLGCDIRHPSGNLPLDYGFTRVRPPRGEHGSSAYLLALRGGGQLALWGFAMWCEGPTSNGGLVLYRHPCTIRTTDEPLRLPLWRVEQLPHGESRSCDDTLRALSHGVLCEAARALADYERWIERALGADYRRHCNAQRPRGVRRRQVVACERLSAAWESLAITAPAPTFDVSTRRSTVGRTVAVRPLCS